MARVLIVGCGCRGRALAAALVEDGHQVRGTTRSPDGLEAIVAVGADAVVADPDRLGTLLPAPDSPELALVGEPAAERPGAASEPAAAASGEPAEARLVALTDRGRREIAVRVAWRVLIVLGVLLAIAAVALGVAAALDANL